MIDAQMNDRCNDHQFFGPVVLKDYSLSFHAASTGYYEHWMKIKEVKFQVSCG